MNKVLVCTVSIIYCFFATSGVLAEADYANLPKLDGKVDSQVIQKPTENFHNSDKTELKQDSKPVKIDLNKIEDKNIEISSAQDEDEKKSITDIDSPQLDLQAPTLSQSHRIDSLNFKEYQKDLNKILVELVELKMVLKDGLDLQMYSARVTDLNMQNEFFKNKYQGKEQCHYETFNMVQDAVNAAVYSRDYWIKSNKIIYNQHGIPDRIIQASFLKITTISDKLVEIIKIQNTLSEE